MATKGYTSRQEVENYLLLNIDSSFHDQVDRWIAEVEKYIEQVTGRVFVADSEDSEKLYDGNDLASIIVDDFVEVTKVEIDDSEIASTGYITYPANEIPKTRIKYKDGIFPVGDQNIKVTAKWGYSVAVPDDIKMAATSLVSGIVRFNKDAQNGEKKSMTIGRFSVTYGSEREKNDMLTAVAILDNYKKYYL